MSQLRSDILHKNKQIAIEKSEKLYKKNHIATSIQPYETSDSEDSGYSDIEEVDDDDIIQVSDEDDTHLQPVEKASYSENDDIVNLTEQWVRIIQNWMGMVGEENIDHLDSNETGPDFIAVD